MIKIANQICYSSAEIVERVGPPFTLKRIEHLKTLGLVPRPIKIGTGNGTKGYYPESVVALLHDIEEKHAKGRSYPDLVPVMGARVAIVEAKMEELKTDYGTKKAISQVEILRRLMSNKHLGVAIKPDDRLRLESKNLDFASEILELQKELKSLFARKDNLHKDVLSKIQATINRLRSLESLKSGYEKACAILRAHIKD